MNRRHCLASLLLAPWTVAVHAAEAQREIWSRQPRKPQLQLPLLDGTPWTLDAHRGQPLLLNFWATWCEPCRTEMPALESLSQRYARQGLQVMAINYREADATVRRFVDTTGLQLPVLRDADGSVARSLGVHAFPTTIAIDRHGRARFLVVGECDWGGTAAARWVSELLSA